MTTQKRKGYPEMKKSRILALVLILVLLTSAFSGCAAKSASYDSSAYVYPQEAPMMEAKAEEAYWPEEPAAYEMPAYEEAEAESIVTSGTAGEPVEYDESVADFTAKIIYSANVSLQSTEFDKAVSTLDQMIASMGGFVESSNVYGDTCYNDDGTTRIINRWAYYTARVPAKNFEAFLTQTSGIGNVISTSRNAENVTSQYTDYEARLSSLNTQEERLLAMLEKAEDVDTLVALEARLGDVRYEIESIERNLRNLDMQISYSTVSISLQEVEIYTPTAPVTRTFGEKLSDALSDGWRSFTWDFQYFFLDLASALPGLILFIVFALIIFFIVRRIVRKAKAKKAAGETDAAPKQEKGRKTASEKKVSPFLNAVKKEKAAEPAEKEADAEAPEKKED